MSPTAVDYLEELNARGVRVEATEGGNLRYAPKDKLDSGDISKLKTRKQEILDLLLDREYRSSLPSLSSLIANKADTYGQNQRDDPRDDQENSIVPIVPATLQAAQQRASELGLIARWSYEFGFFSIHDPTTGKWWDLSKEDAPAWAKREAFKRKELWRSGNKRAFDLTAREMEEVWEEEQAEMWDEPFRPANAKAGLIYEDGVVGED